MQVEILGDPRLKPILGPGGFEASAVSRLLAGNRRVPFDTPELARTRRQMNGDSNDTNIQAEL